MGWLLIRQGNRAPAFGLPRGLLFHQQPDAPLQQANVAFLPRHDIGKIIDRAGQMGHGFFEGGDAWFRHTPCLARARAGANAYRLMNAAAETTAISAMIPISVILFHVGLATMAQTITQSRN